MDVFIELSLIIGFTAVLAGLARLLKQPLIIGYILSGILLGPYFFNVVSSADVISIFSQIGIALLLFIVGLNLSPNVIREVGKVSLVTGTGQILFTSLVGFIICLMMGFTPLVSIYIAIALTFSSTIIIMKLLSDKKDFEKLYGKISIGFLLVQDLVAIVILMVIASVAGGSGKGISLELILVGLGIIAATTFMSVRILPRLSDFFAKSQEFLFLFSIAWGLCMAAVFYILGFSMEVGALIAGVALSMSPYHYEISSKMRPLRDFFILLFFVYLGSHMVFSNISELMAPALLLSAFILVGNPLIVIILMGLMGYRKKTGFQAGFTVAQISEFSLILVAMGVAVGHLDSGILSLVTMVGVITISCSTYLVLYSDRLYPYFSRWLSVFERKNLREKDDKADDKYDIILFGCDRIGSDILETFEKMGKGLLVIDYNPQTIAELSRKGIRCKYGDADDDEFLDELNFDGIRMAISTIPDYEVNSLITNNIRQANKDAIVIAVSYSIDDALRLYKEGATYVILPHFLGGMHASMLVGKHKLNPAEFMKERERQLKWLSMKKEKGHKHPKHERNGY